MIVPLAKRKRVDARHLTFNNAVRNPFLGESAIYEAEGEDRGIPVGYTR